MFLDRIVEELSQGNRIELRDFGVFEVKKRAARKARNPRTGEEAFVPAKKCRCFQGGKINERKSKQQRKQQCKQQCKYSGSIIKLKNHTTEKPVSGTFVPTITRLVS